MRSLPRVRNQLRIRCRYLLWRQDSILSGKCKLKTRTHMGWGNLHPTSLVATRFPSCFLWRQDFILSGKCKLETCTHMGNLAPTSLVATRFHLVGEVQVGNSHPHGETFSHLSLWRQDFHLVGEVQVENSHPHGKTYSPPLFVATRFPSCRGSAS